MYDYATSVYEKKICCINTKYRDSSLQHFPKQSRQHLIIQAELLIERTRGPITTTTTCYFPTISLSEIEPFLPTSFLMPIIKERQGKREKMVSHLCHFRFEVG
jgi:hypothetical protein